jgi:heme exporter protein D
MSEFLHMGGYGAYVWSAMGIVLFLMLLEPLLLIMQRKAILKNIRRMKRLEQRAESQKSTH